MNYRNGEIPLSELVTLPARFQNGNYPIYMPPAAAASILRMEEPFRAGTGLQLKLTDGYRTLAVQRKIFLERYTTGRGGTSDFRRWGGRVYNRRKGTAAAAVPGTSNHGHANPAAADFASTINSFGTAAHNWMRGNAHRFGWVHPSWARAGSRTPEAWHWEYSAARDPLHGTTAHRSVTPEFTVREAQTAAASLGVPVRVDGIDGPETSGAVRALQVTLGVPADGVFGRQTKEKHVATLNDILARLDAIGARVETNNQALGRLEHALLPGIAADVVKTKEAVGRMEGEHGPGKTPTEEAAK